MLAPRYPLFKKTFIAASKMALRFRTELPASFNSAGSFVETERAMYTSYMQSAFLTYSTVRSSLMQVEELDRPVPAYLGGELMHVQFAELPVFNQHRAKGSYVEHFGCHLPADQPMEPPAWRWIHLHFPPPHTTLHSLPRHSPNP